MDALVLMFIKRREGETRRWKNLQLPVGEGRSIFKGVFYGTAWWGGATGPRGARRQARKVHRGAAIDLVTRTFDRQRWPQHRALTQGLCL